LFTLWTSTVLAMPGPRARPGSACSRPPECSGRPSTGNRAAALALELGGARGAGFTSRARPLVDAPGRAALVRPPQAPPRRRLGRSVGRSQAEYGLALLQTELVDAAYDAGGRREHADCKLELSAVELAAAVGAGCVRALQQAFAAAGGRTDSIRPR
jgi:hypothetical protein